MNIIEKLDGISRTLNEISDGLIVAPMKSQVVKEAHNNLVELNDHVVDLIDELIEEEGTEYKTTIHNAQEGLPLKSGAYLVKTSHRFNLWQVLPFSIKFNKFNTGDSQDNDKDSIKGYRWAELPEGATDEY